MTGYPATETVEAALDREVILRRVGLACADAAEAKAHSHQLVERRDRLLEALLATADRALDQAQMSGRGLDRRLIRARRLSEMIGREPLIEDAKVAIACRYGCTPTEAFRVMVRASQTCNMKLRDVALQAVTTEGGSASHH